MERIEDIMQNLGENEFLNNQPASSKLVYLWRFIKSVSVNQICLFRWGDEHKQQKSR